MGDANEEKLLRSVTLQNARAILHARERAEKDLLKANTELAERVAELQQATAEIRDSRRAALNLMEDAVHARNAMERLNAELRASEVLVDSQRQALQMLAEGATLDDVLGFLIGVVERQSAEGMLAAITPLNEAGTHFQRGIGASLPDAFNAAVEGVAVSSPTGLCAHALRRREAATVHDFNADTAWQPFAEFVAPYGLRSGWSVPVISSSGQMLGTFANYYRHAGDPTPQNRELVDMVVRTAAIAIERNRAEAERARLLAREQQARAEAETANHLKDEFLATVSHELRSPLNAIQGWANLLLDSKLDEQASARALETIARNARAQNELISDLLDVSRIIAGKLRFETGEIDLIRVIEAALETVRTAAEAKGVELRLRLDPTAGRVLGDDTRLQQVVWNLLANAIKYTPRGGYIETRLERDDAQAAIIVRDTGEGISPEFLPHIFDRFRQVDGTTTRQHGGLGLGLSIVRHLVEAHGGRVSASSEGAGQGATFTVTLPLMALPNAESGMRLADSTSEQSAIRLSGSRPQSAILAGLRVLVVDDEPDARELLRMALTNRGAEVKAGASVREALDIMEQWEQWRPDVLVSDIGMPGEDGYELMRQVRALPAERGGQVPAVALTGYAGARDAKRVLAAGYQTFLPKPVDLPGLAAAIARLAVTG